MRKMKHTKRVFILIPRSMLTELFEKTRIKITTDPYIPDYGLVESAANSVDHFKDKVLQPIAEKLGVPMITSTINIEVPDVRTFPKGMDIAHMVHSFVWYTLKHNNYLERFTQEIVAAYGVVDKLKGVEPASGVH